MEKINWGKVIWRQVKDFTGWAVIGMMIVGMIFLYMLAEGGLEPR